MPIPFEFVIDRTPVSQQARRRDLVKAWSHDVRSVAEQSWDAASPFGGEVKVVITYFFKEGAPDVDNIPKPILDGLKGLVFADDNQITDLFCRKRDLNRDLRFQNPSTVLVETLRRSDQFLHITVANALSLEVTSW